MANVPEWAWKPILLQPQNLMVSFHLKWKKEHFLPQHTNKTSAEYVCLFVPSQLHLLPRQISVYKGYTRCKPSPTCLHSHKLQLVKIQAKPQSVSRSARCQTQVLKDLSAAINSEIQSLWRLYIMLASQEGGWIDDHCPKVLGSLQSHVKI